MSSLGLRVRTPMAKAIAEARPPSLIGGNVLCHTPPKPGVPPAYSSNLLTISYLTNSPNNQITKTSSFAYFPVVPYARHLKSK